MELSKIKMGINYVLVLPDKHHETYQKSGRETGLISPDFKYEKEAKISVKERNFATTGTVYGLPSELRFNGREIESIKANNTLFIIQNEQLEPINMPLHREIRALSEGSVEYDVPMELCKGDRINFSYTAHKKSKEGKMVIDTELGEMILMKYDIIYMTLDENDQPKKMLNGYVLVEPEEIKVDVENGAEVIKRDSGLVTLAPKQKFKKRKKVLYGEVKLAGTPVRKYLQDPRYFDYYTEIDKETKIAYDSRAKVNFEYESHQILSDKVLHLIQRKDILHAY